MRIRALSLDLVFHDSSELSAALVRELCDSCDRSANGVGARRFPTDLDGRPETFAAGNRGWCRFVDCSRLWVAITVRWRDRRNLAVYDGLYDTPVGLLSRVRAIVVG